MLLMFQFVGEFGKRTCRAEIGVARVWCKDWRFGFRTWPKNNLDQPIPDSGKEFLCVGLITVLTQPWMTWKYLVKTHERGQERPYLLRCDRATNSRT